MMEQRTGKRSAAAALLVALSMMLTSCFVTPGKFDSTLTINQDNSFTFAYQGELFFLPLNPGVLGDDEAQTFNGGDCYDDETFDERECTAEEAAEQKQEWEANETRRQKKDAEESKKMAAMLGGIDPSDPEAGNKMAAMLQRQRGWNTVTYAGEGLFNVDYSVSGQLTHDLTFPVLEGIPVPSPFIQVILRDENQVRVNAPGFAMQEGGSPMTAMLMGGFAQGMGEAASENADGESKMPKMEGTFRVITNGRILANNTDEGPTTVNGGEALTWEISPSTSSAPTALLKLGQ